MPPGEEKRGVKKTNLIEAVLVIRVKYKVCGTPKTKRTSSKLKK